MAPPLGIDFGTSNTSAAWIDKNGQVQVVAVREDSFVLPSVVCFHKNGSVLVGQSARELIADDPKNTIYEAKRFLGRRYLSDYVGRHRSKFAYRLVEGPEGLAAVELFNKIHPLEEVAYEILARIVELANIEADQPFEECVLAVPAHFSNRQRQVLRRTAERLLTVTKMVNEPTAAAIYYAKDQQIDETVLVYDLGGGTLDVSLLRTRRGLVEVLATGGDAFLGGADFDRVIVDLLLERFEREQGMSLELDMIASQRLHAAAERAKIALSTEEETSIRVPFVTVKDDRFIDLESRLSRRDLEELCAPLIERTLGVTEGVLHHAGLAPEDVDELVLVGGQTRMPALRRRLGQRFSVGDEPRMDPELGVAVGAARLGRGLHVLVDVLSVPVGLMVPGEGPKDAVPRNIALPCVRRVPLERRPPEGQDLRLVVFEAQDATSIDRDVLGTLHVDADWLAENPGELAFEIRMSASFELTVFLHAKEGGRREVELQTAESGRHAARPARPSGEGVVRRAPRVGTALRVAVRVEGEPDPPLSLETSNASTGGLYLRTPRPFSLGARVEVELLDLGGRPKVAADVVHSVDAMTAQAIGQQPGMGLKFIGLPPSVRSALEAHLTGAEASEAEDVVLLTEVVEEGAGEGPVARVQAFLQAMAKNQLYVAVGAAPLSSDVEIREALDDIGRVFDAAEKSVGTKEEKTQVSTARRVLTRCRELLLDPRRRLEYDFRMGEVHAEERVAAAARGGIGLGVLCEAWHRVHPSSADRAAIHIAYALKAIRSGDFAAAVDAGHEALKLDPFDVETRSAVEGWRVRAAGGGAS